MRTAAPGLRWLALSLCLAAGAVQAQFSGPPVYTIVPGSQLGPNTGAANLTLTPSATGFTVAGTITVTPPGPAAGLLAQWRVERPIAAGVNNPAFTTSTVLDGFVLPPGPPNAFQLTSGVVSTYVTDTALPGTVVPGSQSSIPMSLVGGGATWPSLLNVSTPFALVTGTSTTYVLRQDFFLDGVLLAGPGGPWLVDVPVDSLLTPVPEPASGLLLGAGLGALLLWRRRAVRRWAPRAAGLALAATLLGTAGQAQAQFLPSPAGDAFFLLPPTSSIGPVTNNLVLTNLSTHFTVSGQAIVTVPAGAWQGPLMTWIVRRALDPAWGTGTLYTATQLIGFSQPPAGGTYGNSSGAAQTYATNYPTQGPGGSISIVPFTLTAGAATWGIIIASSPFTYTSGGTNWVEQRFSLDAEQLAGPGGAWIIDVPLDSFLTTTPVPEPATATLLAMGVLLLGWRGLRDR